MSPDAQPVRRTGRQFLVNGPQYAASHDEVVGDFDSGGSEILESPVEFPAVRGESFTLRLCQNGTGRAAQALQSVEFDLAGADASLAQRVLLTHVFTDIVASTEMAERLGDRAWCLLLAQHTDLVRQHLKIHRGREIDAAGDGFFLVFDCPSRAVQFAVAVRSAMEGIGITLRIGIHTGECEVANGRVVGISVHAAARIANAASAGEILVSSTVRELVAGSEHRFNSKELQFLKGLSEPRQLFALV